MCADVAARRLRGGMRKDRAELQGGLGTLWVSPDGEIHDMDGTHNAWMLDNRELLLDKYGVQQEFSVV